MAKSDTLRLKNHLYDRFCPILGVPAPLDKPKRLSIVTKSQILICEYLWPGGELEAETCANRFRVKFYTKTPRGVFVSILRLAKVMVSTPENMAIFAIFRQFSTQVESFGLQISVFGAFGGLKDMRVWRLDDFENFIFIIKIIP